MGFKLGCGRDGLWMLRGLGRLGVGVGVCIASEAPVRSRAFSETVTQAVLAEVGE